MKFFSLFLVLFDLSLSLALLFLSFSLSSSIKFHFKIIKIPMRATCWRFQRRRNNWSEKRDWTLVEFVLIELFLLLSLFFVDWFIMFYVLRPTQLDTHQPKIWLTILKFTHRSSFSQTTHIRSINEKLQNLNCSENSPASLENIP